ncbi:MAG: ABC transporter ATP-binding protein [Pseudomonadota bacterium]
MTATPEALMQTRALHMRFGDVHAVRGVDLDIGTGTCFGLLGPNGAGKTTTIECMEGIKVPTEGSVRYRGAPLGPHFAEDAGIMFQQTALQEFVTAGEMLTMFGRLYQRTTPLDPLIEACQLHDLLKREPKKLSGGQRQRLLLAIALINDPAILFLDEPTTGLDPQARRNLWALINRIKSEGVTIVMTTHYMDEAHALCDQIAIMDHGKVIAQDTPDALLANTFDDVIMQLPAADWPADIDVPELRLTRSDEHVQLLTRDVNASIADLLQRGVPLRNLRIRSRNLEDLFIELTGRELRN